MFQLAQRRKLYFIASGIIIGLGIATMIYSALNSPNGTPFLLSIDFVGGSIYDFTFTEDGVDEQDIRDVFAEFGLDNIVVQSVGDPSENSWSIRAGTIEGNEALAPLEALNEQAPIDFDTVRTGSGVGIGCGNRVHHLCLSQSAECLPLWHLRDCGHGARRDDYAERCVVYGVIFWLGS